MPDIICSVPWHCGDRRCPVGWHRANYWLDDESGTGFTCDRYGDGDHDECDEEDVPMSEQQDEAWTPYAQDCLATGQDPLDEYTKAPRALIVNECWQAEFQAASMAVELLAARQHDQPGWLFGDSIPENVIQFLEVERWRGRLRFPPVEGEEHSLETMRRLGGLVNESPDCEVLRVPRSILRGASTALALTHLRVQFQLTKTTPRSDEDYAADVRREAQVALGVIEGRRPQRILEAGRAKACPGGD